MAKRYRLRFTFWLDMLKPDELVLADQVELLKNERSFASAIRDGLRLIVDLRKGKTDVLFELFPWVKNELYKPVVIPQDNALSLHLKRLEELIQHQAAFIPDKPKQATTNDLRGPKPIAVPQFALPTFDDDEDLETVVVSRDTSTNASLNFINSMLNLQQ